MLSKVSTTTERTTAWPALAGGPQFVAIDSNGNLTSKVEDGHSWSYEWNAENQLKRVLRDALEVARFAYDPKGRRVEKVASGVTTAWAFSGDSILTQSSGGASLRWVQGPDIDAPLAAESGSGQIVYEHADALGSELATTNAAGAVTSSRTYDAFGQPQASATSGYAFTGREWDFETGLHFYRARYYEATTGRFIGEDPLPPMILLAIEGSLHRYSYVGNNPQTHVDPFGLSRGGSCSDPPSPNLPGARCRPSVCRFIFFTGRGYVCGLSVLTTSCERKRIPGTGDCLAWMHVPECKLPDFAPPQVMSPTEPLPIPPSPLRYEFKCDACAA